MKLTHYTTTGTQSQMALPAWLSGEVNDVELAKAIRVYRSNARQGTSKVKTRSEVNRTKKKWFKQKGTGNARHGARTANIFVGGGISHGPNGMQNWVRSLPQRAKHQALHSALLAQIENVVIHDGLSELKGKTKAAAQLVATAAGRDARVLVILSETQPAVVRSLANLANVLTMTAGRVTALEVATADKVVTTAEALKVLETRLMASIAKAEQPKVEAEAPKKVAKAKPAAKPVKKVAKTAKATK